MEAAFSGLRVGSQGTDVKALQQALIDAGVTVTGGADGVFGPATRQAVIDFQSSRGLSATGEVDEATSSALATNSGGSSGSTNTSSVGLGVGAKGAAVTDVQQRLMKLGVYLAGGADGVFGNATKTAVTQFQRWNGLEPTGTVNDATAKKLGLTGNAGTTAPPVATTPTNSSNAYVGLANGARGALVKDLQTALQSSGIAVRGGADGVFGSATATALKAFQRVNGLPETGVVTDRAAELMKLGGATATTPPASNAYLGLKVGARGPAVKETQQALITAGVSVRGGADGVFGNVTKEALVSYQTAVGVTADGTVNAATVAKLGLGSGTAPVGIANTGATPAPAPTPPTSSNPYVGLTVGARGPLVKEVQTALQSTGLVVRGGADGVFGSATATALKAFQSVNGIPQTGIVTERGAGILNLGSGSVGIVNPNTGGSGGIALSRFPVQGRCFFGDTWGAARGGSRTHEGVDIIANQGNLLYAVVDGEISKQYWDQPGALSGNGLRVAQPNGTYFTYLHMSAFAPGIKVGTKVRAGDVIGLVGTTGSSATPHLHFEIHPNGGGAVNPYPYVKAIDGCSNTTPQYQSSFG